MTARPLCAMLLLWLCAAAVAAGDDRDRRIAEWIAQLDSPREDERVAAIRELIGQGAAAVPALAEALSHPSEQVREFAVDVLWRLGPDAVPALPAIGRAVGDPGVGVAVNAACCIGGLGPLAESQIPALTNGLGHRQWVVRAYAALALASMGPRAFEAGPRLLEALADVAGPRVHGEDEWVLRRYARGTLDSFGSRALPFCETALSTHPVPRVRVQAAVTIMRLDARGAPAIPTLLRAIRDDPDEQVRDASERALGAIGKKLKAEGSLLLWVVPRHYLREGVAIVLLLGLWFAIARLASRFWSRGPVAFTALNVAVTLAPSALLTLAVLAVTRVEWAEGFLPQPVIGVVSAPVMTSSSLAFCCLLASLFACRRPANLNQQPADEAPDAST